MKLDSHPFLLLVLTGMAACHHIGPPRIEVLAPKLPPSGEFWILADTQFDDVAGDHDSAESHDALENVAIRPPSLDLWSEVVLKAVLATTRANPLPTFFLGDGANTSCAGEYQHFLAAMGDGPWFAALGNHDGFYMGNLSFDGSDNEWARACARDSPIPETLSSRLAIWDAIAPHAPNTLPKSSATLLYLNNLYVRHIIDRDPLSVSVWSRTDAAKGYLLDITGTYAVVDSTQLKIRITAFISTAMPQLEANKYLSFVLQDVELPGHDHVLLVDTSDYVKPPPTGYAWATFKSWITHVNNLPGELGMIGNLQSKYIERDIGLYDNVSRFFVAGHHDWQDLSVPGARNLRNAAFEDARFATYLSGHTHDPTATGGFNGAHQWEINIASVTDWPMEFARIAYWPASYDDRNPSTDVAVDVHAIRSPSYEKSCVLASAESTIEAARARELDYRGPRYVEIALGDYDFLLRNIPKADAKAVNDTCGSDCIGSSLVGIARELASGNEESRKLLLRRLVNDDIRAFRQSGWVRNQEYSCAIWASDIEQHYWAGTWVGKFWRRVWSHPKSEKTPIDYGNALPPDQVTTFRISHDDLPGEPTAR